MQTKGLFELVFILVMLVLLLPATTQRKAIVTYSAHAQVNDLLLLTDEAIADALADCSHIGCSPNADSAKINTYISNIITAHNNLGNNCGYELSGNLASSIYTADLNVFCLKDNGSNSTYVKKQIRINKTITAISMPLPSSCRVIIYDNIGDYNQVDYTA